jgi:hypothetical protein
MLRGKLSHDHVFLTGRTVGQMNELDDQLSGDELTALYRRGFRRISTGGSSAEGVGCSTTAITRSVVNPPGQRTGGCGWRARASTLRPWCSRSRPHAPTATRAPSSSVR